MQRPERANDAARSAFGVDESRKQRADREAIDIAGVDTGEERIGKVVHRFASESPADEGADLFILIDRSTRHNHLARHPRLAGEREQP